MWASRGSLRIRCSVIYWLTGACIAWFTTMLGCCGAITKNKIMLIVVSTTPTSAGCNLHCASLEAYICYDYWSLFRIVLTATFMYQGTFCNCYKCNDCIVLRGCFFFVAVLMRNDCCLPLHDHRLNSLHRLQNASKCLCGKYTTSCQFTLKITSKL